MTYLTQATISVENQKSELQMGPVPSWMANSEMESKLKKTTLLLKSTEFHNSIVAEAMGDTNLLAKDRQVMRDLKLIKSYLMQLGKNANHNQAVKKSIRHQLDLDRKLIMIRSETLNAGLSRAFANTAALMLVHLNQKLQLQEMNSVAVFIRKQTEKAERRLNELENELARTQKAEKMISVDRISGALDSAYQSDRALIAKIQVEIESNKLLVNQIEESIGEFKSSMQQSENSHLYLKQLQKKIDLLRYQKSIKSADSSKHKKLREIDNNLNEALGKFNSRFKQAQGKWLSTDPWEYFGQLEQDLLDAKQAISVAETKLKAYERRLDKKTKAFERLPEVVKKMTQLKRNIQITAQLYSQLKSKEQETEIRKIGKSNPMKILIFAAYPSGPLGMGFVKKVIISFLFGAVIIMLGLSFRYVLVPTVRGQVDMENIGTEFLVEFPWIRSMVAETKTEANHPLLLKVQPMSKESNLIRQARFYVEENLSLSKKSDDSATVITVVSSNSMEGKTFLSANLAHAFSMAKFKVLLLDFDLLKPDSKKYLFPNGTDNGSGNGSNEVEQVEKDDMILEKISYSPHLDLMQFKCEKSRAMDVLESPALAAHVEEIKKTYDIVLVDTPPLKHSLEALIAIRFSDGILLVANQRSSMRDDVQKRVQLLRKNFDGPIMSLLNFSYDKLSKSKRRVA